MQDGLSAAGMVPALGMIPDTINTVISLGRGRWSDAALNGLAMVPALGQFATAGKFTLAGGGVLAIALKYSDEAADVARLGDKVADTSRGAIGFAKGTGKTAFTPNRLQHASRHLIEEGLLPNWSKATGKQFTEVGTEILENPQATFDYVLKGNQAVKGFIGKIMGQDVAVMVYKSGKYQGQVATAVVPTPAQMIRWGL